VSERLDAETIVDGRYRILGRLGAGGMAEVYRAEDLQLGRNVALKVLYRRFAEDQEFVERFRREAQSAAGLQHQHVVSVYDRGEYDGTYYIAMELLEGRSLKRVVEEEAPLDPARAIDLIVQVLRAARFAHRRGIIHRDFKPHNVIIDEEDRAKVTDFGIARAGASDMTQTGSIMGTAQYLSPEQAQGHAVSAASDLYSIGIMLYELLTGRVPFEGESAVTIALKQVSESPVPPSAYNAAVTPELEAVVLRALEKDPARRFNDADEFVAALEHARATLGAGAAGPTSVMPPTPQPQAAVPMAAYPPDEPPPGERTGGRWWWWALAALVVAAVVVGALLLAGGGKKVTVPEVVGVDEPSARAALTRDGFDVESSRRSDDKPRGTVIGQDPSGGSKAKEGSTVQITVSDGPATVRIPPVEGLTYESARNRLEKAGFKVSRRDAASDTVERGRVVSSTPQEGTEADRGETVELVVSSGRKKVTVPDVTGRSEDAARSALEDEGLKVTVRRQDSQNEDPGTVLAQDPKGGSEVDAGSSVALTVAREPREVTVPDVTGEDAADAVARLSDEGFRIRQRQQDVDSPEGDGVVIEQNPAGGRAPRGSTVTITVGRFTGTTTQQQQTTPQQGTTTGGNGNATPGTTPGTTDGTSG
jgi:beta-lactam-binding protein with PASTA domain/tRNA A-37 threonylcarbamoyl transferase component Bud32